MLKTRLTLFLVFVATALSLAALLTIPQAYELDRDHDLDRDLATALDLVELRMEARQTEAALGALELAADPRVLALVTPAPEPPAEAPPQPRGKKPQDEQPPPEVPPGPPPALEALGPVTARGGFTSAGIVDSAGLVLISNDEEFKEGANLADAPAIEAALAGGSATGASIWVEEPDSVRLVGAATLRVDGHVVGSTFVLRRLGDETARILAGAGEADSQQGASMRVALVVDKTPVAVSDDSVELPRLSEALDATSISVLDEPKVRGLAAGHDGAAITARLAGSDVAVIAIVERSPVSAAPDVLLHNLIGAPPSAERMAHWGIVGGSLVLLFVLLMVMMSFEHRRPAHRLRQVLDALKGDLDRYSVNPKAFRGSYRGTAVALAEVVEAFRQAKEAVAKALIGPVQPAVVAVPQKRRGRPVIVETSQSREQDDAKAVTTENRMVPPAPLDPDSFSRPSMVVPVVEQSGDEWAMPSPEPPPGGYEPAPLRIPEGGYEPETTEADDLAEVEPAAPAAPVPVAPAPSAPAAQPLAASQSPAVPPADGPVGDVGKKPRVTRPAPAVANFMSAASVDLTAEDPNDATVSLKSDQYAHVLPEATVDNYAPPATDRESTVNMDPGDLDGLFTAPDASTSQTQKLLEKLRKRDPTPALSASEQAAYDTGSTIPISRGIIGRMVHNTAAYEDNDPTKVVASSGDHDLLEAQQQQQSLTPKSLLGALKQRSAVPPARRAPTGSPLEPTHVTAMQQARAAGASDAEAAEFHRLYGEFVATKQRCGEPTEGLTLERFIRRLQRNKEKLTQKYQCRSVRFKVYTKDGKAALKATPLK